MAPMRPFRYILILNGDNGGIGEELCPDTLGNEIFADFRSSKMVPDVGEGVFRVFFRS